MAVDVARAREAQRLKRLRRIAILLAPLAAWLWVRALSGNPVSPGLPSLPEDAIFWMPGIVLVGLLAIVLVGPMLGNSRSPHTIYLPEQIEVGFGDVKGLGGVLGEVRHTLDVFLNNGRFQEEMGGKARRGVLFEGPPGTGKTHLAKAMAKEAGVPFLFVAATSFQSMWYGMTARKIRSFFRSLRKVARREGGAIGFIEEIDAIASKRGGMDFGAATPAGDHGRSISPTIASGTGGIVNELLVQMQSFDESPTPTRIRNWFVAKANAVLPPHRQFKAKKPPYSNILLIAATNRAEALDPALLRPGRFDRTLHFGLPGRSDRRQLIDYSASRRTPPSSTRRSPGTTSPVPRWATAPLRSSACSTRRSWWRCGTAEVCTISRTSAKRAWPWSSACRSLPITRRTSGKPSRSTSPATRPSPI